MNDDNAVSQLSALAQATRFAVFRLLMRFGKDGMAAGDIAKQLGVPQNTLSAHLNILSNAHLIVAKRDGRSVIYSINVDSTRDLMSYLVNDCCDGHPEICSISVEQVGCS
ncbi:ArsR/SmtB family transcription factor [Kordiimonas sp.]|uniref:ArsR/SmtB family transcription factor n=1 Tax=Kordiimonas sp. TaxID=1970157 RepID=UPI003A95C7A5